MSIKHLSIVLSLIISAFSELNLCTFSGKQESSAFSEIAFKSSFKVPHYLIPENTNI